MHWAMHLSPRCGAKTRSATPCRAPAMPNGRCRMHGGASPGAPMGKRNGMYKHGNFTNDALAKRAEVHGLIRQMRRAINDLSGAASPWISQSRNSKLEEGD